MVEKPGECHTIEYASCQLRMREHQGRVSILLNQSNSHIIFSLPNFLIIYLPSKCLFHSQKKKKINIITMLLLISSPKVGTNLAGLIVILYLNSLKIWTQPTNSFELNWLSRTLDFIDEKAYFPKLIRIKLVAEGQAG